MGSTYLCIFHFPKRHMMSDECSCSSFISFRIHYSLNVTSPSLGILLFVFGWKWTLSLLHWNRPWPLSDNVHSSVLPFEMESTEPVENPTRTLTWKPLAFLSHIKRRTNLMMIVSLFPLVWFFSSLGVPIPALTGPLHGQRIIDRLGRTLLDEHQKLFDSYWWHTFGPSGSLLQLLGKGISIRTSQAPQGG